MSMEQARKFIERMKTDEAFRAKILAVEDVAGRLALAQAEGYEFTQEEIKSASAEMSEAELNDVAGGVPGVTSCGGGLPEWVCDILMKS